MNKFIILIALIALIVLVVGTKKDTSIPKLEEISHQIPNENIYASGPTFGVGMNGKPGINLTGEGVGIHIDMDGNIGIGYGF